jgi:Tol biopolymer transport system component
VEGSDNAEGPFWSPDSTQIGFAAGREIRKTRVQGGATFTLGKLNQPYRGGAWSPKGDSIIVSVAARGLFEVPAAGGVLKEVLAATSQATAFFSPHFLPAPGGSRLLLAGKGTRGSQVVELIDLDTRKTQTLREGAYPVWSVTGHILFKQSPFAGVLLALPFSLSRRAATGDAFPVLNQGTDFNVSDDGTLVWTDLLGGINYDLAWIDRAGKRRVLNGLPRIRRADVALSPDGGRAVYTVSDQRGADVWTLDLVRSVQSLLTNAPEVDHLPRWSPSGKEIAFGSLRRGRTNIYVQPADGSADAKLAVQSPGPDEPQAWSPDGQVLLFTRRDPVSGLDLWTVRRKADLSFDEPSGWLRSAFDEYDATFSPDGRFVAYSSNESERPEIFVRSYPSGTNRRQVSSGGGAFARWSRDGKEIFYMRGDVLVAVSVNSGTVSLGTSQDLFRVPIPASAQPHQPYDVSPDGQHFLFAIAEVVEPTNLASIHIIQNWPLLLRQRASATK